MRLRTRSAARVQGRTTTSAAAVVAVSLDLLFNHIRVGNRPGASVVTAAPDARGTALRH